MKVKTKSKKVNKAWLNDHVNDTYVKLAAREGTARAPHTSSRKSTRPSGLIGRGTWWSTSGRARRLEPVRAPRGCRRSGAAVGAAGRHDPGPGYVADEPIEGVHLPCRAISATRRCWRESKR